MNPADVYDESIDQIYFLSIDRSQMTQDVSGGETVLSQNAPILIDLQYV
jgi:hypothetical protein